MNKIDKKSSHYILAERIIFLEAALATANQILNNHKLLGVLPDRTPRLKERIQHKKKVMKLLLTEAPELFKKTDTEKTSVFKRKEPEKKTTR